jgi:hypothetical protein
VPSTRTVGEVKKKNKHKQQSIDRPHTTRTTKTIAKHKNQAPMPFYWCPIHNQVTEHHPNECKFIPINIRQGYYTAQVIQTQPNAQPNAQQQQAAPNQQNAAVYFCERCGRNNTHKTANCTHHGDPN